MKPRVVIVLLMVAAAAPAGILRPRNERIEGAVESLQPAVVKIFGAKGFRGIYGYMTGVLVHESGLVITRGSVTLEEVSSIRCHLHDGRRRIAQLIREDRKSRMVLLKLVGEKKGETFPVAKLGSAKDVRPGRFVLLFGNAYNVAAGREKTAVNLGVVTAYTSIRMRRGLSDFRYPGKVILHDAMNNPGVYGGPLADLDGEVIGISGTIVESKATNAQVHYAIPIDDLKPFVEDTLENPGAGRVYDPGGGSPEAETDKTPGYHGIRVLKGGINRATPAYVDRVRRGSPAAEAGLRPDDLVLQIDQTPVKSWKSFVRVMKQYRAGETARLTIKRGDEIKVVPLTLAPAGEEPNR